MTEVKDQCGTEPAPSADTTPLGRFIARAIHHQRRLAAGDDPLDVDIAIAVETRNFLNFAGVRLPSDEFLHALSDVLSGGDPAYFNRRQPHPPALLRHQQLVGLVAFLVETLIAGKVFNKGKAAAAVASKSSIPESTVSRWHRTAVHHAKTDDPAHDILMKQQRALKLLHPDHRQWGEARLKEWLAEFCKKPAFLRLSSM